MTEISNLPVDNGERLRVQCPFFSGIAGVRRNGNGGQFACAAAFTIARGEVEGTIGGRTVTITDVRKSDTATVLLVAQFEYKGEA